MATSPHKHSSRVIKFRVDSGAVPPNSAMLVRLCFLPLTDSSMYVFMYVLY